MSKNRNFPTENTAAAFLYGRHHKDWDDEMVFAEMPDYDYVVSGSKITTVAKAIDDISSRLKFAAGFSGQNNPVAIGDALSVYLDDNGDVASVIVMTTKLGKITRVTAAKDDADYDYTVGIRVYDTNDTGTVKSYTDDKLVGFDADTMTKEIGRASCRERVCQYV